MSEAARMTKKAINQLQVAERKSMREKQKNSEFMRKTSSIYKGMRNRADDMRPPQAMDFSLEDLRCLCREAIDEGLCRYCGGVLKLSNLAVDHRNPVARGGMVGDFLNVYPCCKSCNWQKGIMDAEEFRHFLDEIQGFPAAVQADIKRRLTIGGKWSFSK